MVGLLIVSTAAVPLANGAVDPAIRSALQTPGPELRVTNLQAPTTAATGSTITVTATIQNTGSSTGSTKVEYRFNGETLMTKSRTLRAGARDTVTFSVTVPNVASGTYTHGVFLGTSNRGQTTTIAIAQSDPRFRISDLRAPSQAAGGTEITVQAIVVNSGTVDDSRTVEYRLGDRTLASKRIALDAGASTNVVFTVSLPTISPGTYRQGVFFRGTDIGESSTLLIEDASMFHITDLETPPEARVGDQIAVRAVITNTGTGTGSIEVQYRIGGSTIDAQTVELRAGTSKRVVFSVRVPSLSAGTYTQGVFLADTDQGQTADLSVQGRAAFGILNLNAPASTTSGDSITVEATVTNTGTTSGSTEVQYRIGQEVIGSETVSLEAGESTTVTFDVDVPALEPGTYSHGVFVGTSDRGQTSNLEIATPATPTPTATQTPQQTQTRPQTATQTQQQPDSPGQPGFGLTVGVLALLLVTVLILARRLR